MQRTKGCKAIPSLMAHCQRIQHNKQFIELEISHLLFWPLHLLLNLLLFMFQFLFNLHLILLLLFSQLLFLYFIFEHFYFFLHFPHFFLVFFGLWSYTIFGFPHPLDSNWLAWIYRWEIVIINFYLIIIIYIFRQKCTWTTVLGKHHGYIGILLFGFPFQWI